MRNGKYLLLAAVVGTVLSYYIVSRFIIEISFLRYIVVELVIALFHSLYNRLKLEFNE
jgi:hypothetical protein